jgi:biotin synthase
MHDIICSLRDFGIISREELTALISSDDKMVNEELALYAREKSTAIYGKQIYVRGLIEFTNYCKNGCLYCGINRANTNIHRYRLDKETILNCCRAGDELGFKTFVLQGGEDSYYTDDIMCDMVSSIKSEFPNNAITLSLGERSYDSYKRLFEAGADRYLLRHETATASHYAKLHPDDMSFDNRMECLRNLKAIGYQVGCGIMVGSPYQTAENLADDLLFMQSFRPQMIGIGPFIAHNATVFANEPNGSVELTLRLLSIIRLMLPEVLLPATTALGTLDPMGRERGILAGANVLMPNLSPTAVRKDYALYDNKICTGDEAAECKNCLARRVANIGYELAVDRGDSKLTV